MSKLVLLKKEKNESKYISLKNNNEDLNNRYFNFENKIFNNQFYSEVNNNEISNCIKKIFYLNKSVFINFLNSIYSDFLGTNSIVHFSELENSNNCFLKCPNAILKARVEDEYRIYEYNIEIQCTDIENIAMLFYKKEIDNRDNKVVNFIKKKEEYKSLLDTEKELENPDVCLVMLNANMNVPDKFKLKDDVCVSNKNLKIIKAWKYDIKEVYKNKQFMLLPLKIIDLKNLISSLQSINNSDEIIEKEIKRFYMTINKFLDILKENKTINDKDIIEFNAIAKEFLNLIY